MEIEEALHTYLSEFKGLSDMGAKVYPDTLPELGRDAFASGVLPAIVYQRISTADVQSHQGSSGLSAARFQFSVFGTTKGAAVAVREQLRLALEGFHGTMAEGGVEIGASLRAGARSMYDPLLRIYREDSDFMIWHAVTQPT